MRTFLRSLFRPARPIRRQQPKGLALAIEHLEDRQLMAAGLDVSFDLADRLLRIQASPEADHIQVVNNAGQISVADHTIRIIDGDTEYQADALDVSEISQAMVLDLGADDVLDVLEQDVAPEMALSLAVFNAEPAVDVHAAAIALDEQLGLTSNGDLWENWGGAGDKWMQGAAGEWYFILPDGGLYAWDGSAGASGAFVGQLDEAHYLDPTLLFDAYQPEAAAPELTFEEELNQVFTTLDVSTQLPITTPLVNLPRSSYEVQPSYSSQAIKNSLISGISVTSTFNAIDKKYKDLGGAAGFLGLPTGATQTTPEGVKFRHYQGGSIYWTQDTGALMVRGAIRDQWLNLGAERGFLGLMTGDTVMARAGVYMSEFRGGNIYWSAETGAHEVHGLIGANYKFIGGPNSAFGLPTSDELPLANGGRYSLFQNGAIYWTPEGGVRMVQGAIAAKYLSLGGPAGFLGQALTNEMTAPDGVGKYTHFQNGSIYWSPSTGAHVIYGAIRDFWAGMGWEKSILGYPTSDEFAHEGGRASNFQFGSIVWNWNGQGGARLSFGRDEMIRFLERAGVNGVTGAELAKLQAMAFDSDIIMPAHVRSLMIKVVYPNDANDRVYHQPLGSLFAGSSQDHMQRLIDKWFRGTDVPHAMDTMGNVYGFGMAAGSLFGAAGPQLADIDQQATGDCYFLASLGAAVLKDPQFIRDMFIDNGDGTFTVRFWNDGRPDYVTVDRQLPVDATNRSVFARFGSASDTVGDPTNILWVALAEKAYAQLNQLKWIEQDGTNSYQGIAGGRAAYALNEITNIESRRVGLSAWTLQAFISDLQDGRMIVLSTPEDADDVSHPLLVPKHTYTLVSAGNGGFLLYNPWGVDTNTAASDGANDGYVFLTLDQLMDNFTAWHAA